MTNEEHLQVFTAQVAYPVVYLARRCADRTVVTTRLAGSAADWATGESPLLPVIERQIQLVGHILSQHWAFGGRDDHELEGLVVMPAQGFSSVIGAFRVNIQRHESEADSAIIVLQRVDESSSHNAKFTDPKLGSTWPIAHVLEATSGLWSLAGCCHYVYEINSRDELRIHMMEGPFPLIFGVGSEEMKVPTFAMFLRNILPEDRPFIDAIRKILVTNGSWSAVYRVRGKDGYIRHMRHFAVYHAYQGSAFISGVILDESALANEREESSAFRLAVDNSREGFAIADPNGRFAYLNQEHARLFGYEDAGELLGKEWTTSYRAAEVELIHQKISQELEKAGYWHGHVLAQRKDGTTFQQDLTLSLLASRGILCISRDKTEELRVQIRLEESETMLRTLFDALPMGIVIRDEHGARHFANGFMLRGNGTAAVEIPGADWIESDPGWKRRQIETDQDVLATGKSSEYVIESEIAQQKRWYHCIVFLVPASSGGGRRIASLVIDITKQQQLEQEAHILSERRRDFLEMQREFISMVSHEFRTPLTAIQGAQYLLEKLLKESAKLSGPVAEKTEKWLGLQASGVATLRKLVDQVLVLNRIEHLSGDASLAFLSPAEVIAGTVARFNDSMDSSRVVLRNDVPSGFFAPMDPELVKAAVENLISNGLKYSGLKEAVRVRVYTEPNGWAVEVVDQGRGIPLEDQPNLFRPFFRAGNVGTVTGSGLGLAIVRRAVDFHGGDIDFESKKDAGTCFKLRFPNVVRTPLESSRSGRTPSI